jgi:hypothetical protein
MPTWFSQLRNLVWTSVLAVIMGSASVIIAIAGGSIEVVVSLALFGAILSTLSSKVR